VKCRWTQSVNVKVGVQRKVGGDVTPFMWLRIQN